MYQSRCILVNECLLCVFFLLSSQPRLSSVSVVFDFNALPNDFIPAAPMLLSVDLMRKENSELLMPFVCILSFIPTTQIKLSECCV